MIKDGLSFAFTFFFLYMCGEGFVLHGLYAKPNKTEKIKFAKFLKYIYLLNKGCAPNPPTRRHTLTQTHPTHPPTHLIILTQAKTLQCTFVDMIFSGIILLQ